MINGNFIATVFAIALSVFAICSFNKQTTKKENFILGSSLTVSNEKVESTGWKPEWDLDMGIKELIMAYQMIVPKMGAEFRNGFPLGYANQT
jgi:hypothetical protein